MKFKAKYPGASPAILVLSSFVFREPPLASPAPEELVTGRRKPINLGFLPASIKHVSRLVIRTCIASKSLTMGIVSAHAVVTASRLTDAAQLFFEPWRTEPARFNISRAQAEQDLKDQDLTNCLGDFEVAWVEAGVILPRAQLGVRKTAEAQMTKGASRLAMRENVLTLTARVDRLEAAFKQLVVIVQQGIQK